MIIIWMRSSEWMMSRFEFALFKNKKWVTMERLERLTGISTDELRHSLDTLVRMGLVRRMKQDVVEINRFVQHLLVSHLTERGLLQ